MDRQGQIRDEYMLHNRFAREMGTFRSLQLSPGTILQNWQHHGQTLWSGRVECVGAGSPRPAPQRSEAKRVSTLRPSVDAQVIFADQPAYEADFQPASCHLPADSWQGWRAALRAKQANLEMY